MDDLVFLWKDGDPVQITNNLNLPRFTLEKFDTDYCNSKTNTGIVLVSSVLQGIVRLKIRIYGIHVYNTLHLYVKQFVKGSVHQGTEKKLPR